MTYLRPRRHRSWVDDVDPDGLNVFIPGALASGFLVSVALLIGDGIRKLRGGGVEERRAELTADALAEETRYGIDAANLVVPGLRTTRTYAVSALAALGIAVAVIPGATWNFLNPVGYIRDIGWIWAISLVGAMAFAVLGLRILNIVPEWTPRIALVLGALVAIRFAVGTEATIVRVLVIPAALVTAVAVAAFTRDLGNSRLGVPPRVRPLLRSTPFGTTRRQTGRPGR